MITVERSALLAAMDMASLPVERRNVIPVLGTIKLRANGVLALESSNLDTTMRVELPYVGDETELCLPEPRAVRRALAQAGAGSVSISEKVQVVRTGKESDDRKDYRVEIGSGALGASLPSVPAEDHPGADGVHFEEWSADLGEHALAQLLRVMPAISTEETRYYLNGVCVDQVDEWTWRFVATDGHRIMIADVPLPGASGVLPPRVILPKEWVRHALALFGKTKEPVKLRYGRAAYRNERGPELIVEPGSGRIEMSGQAKRLPVTVASKLIDGTYPEYTRVIPASVGFGWRFQRAELLRALHALSALAEGKVRAIKLSSDQRSAGVSVSLNSALIGEASITVSADGVHPGAEPFIIGFNARYLIDMLNALAGEEVELGLTDGLAPVTVRDPADTGFSAVLMPMRV